MERAIASAEGEDFDLAQVVRGCAEAYRALAAPRRLECVMDVAHAPLHGAPELIAQALDKLFDNALSFTPAEGWIRIELRGLDEDEGAQLIVANSGPPLPEAMSGRLFDSLVSVRGSGARVGVPHLGLGLYVVRLVTELHQGKVEAQNLDEGVAFTMQLRGMVRRRLAE